MFPSRRGDGQGTPSEKPTIVDRYLAQKDYPPWMKKRLEKVSRQIKHVISQEGEEHMIRSSKPENIRMHGDKHAVRIPIKSAPARMAAVLASSTPTGLRTTPVKTMDRVRHRRRHSLGVVRRASPAIASGAMAEWPGLEAAFADRSPGRRLSADAFSDSEEEKDDRLAPPAATVNRVRRRSSLTRKPDMPTERRSAEHLDRVHQLRREADTAELVRSTSATYPHQAAAAETKAQEELISEMTLSEKSAVLAVHLVKSHAPREMLSWLLTEHEHIDDLESKVQEERNERDAGSFKIAVLQEVLRHQEEMLAATHGDFTQLREHVNRFLDEYVASRELAYAAHKASGNTRAFSQIAQRYRQDASQAVEYIQRLLGETNTRLAPSQKVAAFFSRCKDEVESLDDALGNFQSPLVEALIDSRHLHIEVAGKLKQYIMSHLSHVDFVADLSMHDLLEMHSVSKNVNAVDDDGSSLLQIAINQGDFATALLLFKQGADLRHFNHRGIGLPLNKITITKEMLDVVIVDYLRRDHVDIGKHNIAELRALQQGNTVSMGAIMRILLHNGGGWTPRSLKMLLAHHMGTGIQHDREADTNEARQLCADWFVEMVNMKLGIRGREHKKSADLVIALAQYALERIHTSKGQAIVDKLFEMDAMGGNMTAEKLHMHLYQTFFRTWTTQFGDLKTPIGEIMSEKRHLLGKQSVFYEGAAAAHFPQALQVGTLDPSTIFDERDALALALLEYQQTHAIVTFKSNYNNGLKLLQKSGSKLPIGGVMKILLSSSGGWDAGRSFKRLLAKRLSIHGMDNLRDITPARAERRCISWCEERLLRHVLGANPYRHTRSVGLLRTILAKAFCYADKIGGMTKMAKILDAIEAIDSRDIQHSEQFDRMMFNKLHAALDGATTFHSGVTARPQLAQAFSHARFLGSSHAGRDLAREVTAAAAAA